ncbi:MAG: TonB-dependent receptor [Hyphomicrobiaceae bacterium]
MSRILTRRVFFGASALSMLSHSPTFAQENIPEVTLPEIEIIQQTTVATPVKKAKRKKNAKKVKQAQETQQAPTSTASPQPSSSENEFADQTSGNDAIEDSLGVTTGQLIVVDDAFVPVTIATFQDALRLGSGNLADVLDKRPGIASSTFAPGASRPVIRGLDNYRVRVQENGIGSHDVSALSEDHAVPVDPFASEQIEVIRGPATLRYGSQAIGGVVASENGRIPTRIPETGFSGKVIGDYSSVDRGKNGGFKATAGARGIAVHADGFIRRSDDYDTPRGKQFNTSVETESGALGGSIIGQSGYFGLSLSRYQSFYGIPGEEATELMPRIDLLQDRLQARGELNVRSNGIEAVRFWFGASDYEHAEIVDEGEGDEVGSLFENDEIEGRVEIQHSQITSALGVMRGAIGVQLTNRETQGQSFEGDSLLQPTTTNSFAVFLFEELDVSPILALQAAARIEHNDIDGFARAEPLNADLNLAATNRDFTAFGLSVGGLIRLSGGSVVSLNTQYVERAPDASELFSAGIHEATGTFEIGNSQLKKEKAVTVELGWRKAKGPLRFDTTAFYTRFDGFIFKNLTGVACEGTLESCGEEEEHAQDEGHGHEALDQVLFQQRDANFFGVELAAQYDVGRILKGVWGVDVQYDFVRARFDEGGNVPRIPPHRVGSGLFYRDGAWLATAGVLHAFGQNQTAENEISTPGYTLITADISYTISLGPNAFDPKMTLGLRGENLGNDEVLNHTSFKRREDVLLPGASIKVYGSIELN